MMLMIFFFFWNNLYTNIWFFFGLLGLSGDSGANCPCNFSAYQGNLFCLWTNRQVLVSYIYILSSPDASSTCFWKTHTVTFLYISSSSIFSMPMLSICERFVAFHFLFGSLIDGKIVALCLENHFFKYWLYLSCILHAIH